MRFASGSIQAMHIRILGLASVCVRKALRAGGNENTLIAMFSRIRISAFAINPTVIRPRAPALRARIGKPARNWNVRACMGR